MAKTLKGIFEQKMETVPRDGGEKGDQAADVVAEYPGQPTSVSVSRCRQCPSDAFDLVVQLTRGPRTVSVDDGDRLIGSPAPDILEGRRSDWERHGSLEAAQAAGSVDLDGVVHAGESRRW